MAKRKASDNPKSAAGPSRAPRQRRLYTLEVTIIGGPVTEEFVSKNPVLSRTIQIRGDQKLEHLHYAIFDAFDREEEHLYEFRFGKNPHDRNSICYVMPMTEEPMFGPTIAGIVTRTAIDSLDLHARQKFFYWFDFGDDWWHEIKVLAIEPAPAGGKYPKVTQRIGASPPQYPDLEDEDADFDDEPELEEPGENAEA